MGKRCNIHPVCHPDKISPRVTPRSTSVLLDFHLKTCLSRFLQDSSSEGSRARPSVLSTLAGTQVFNSLIMSRITGISNRHWDHCVTQKPTTGTVADGTGEAAMDRHMALKAESCQLQATGGSVILKGDGNHLQLLPWYRVFHENKTDPAFSFVFSVRSQTLFPTAFAR